LWIGQEFEQILRLDAAANRVEHRRSLALNPFGERRIGRMAARAIEFPEQELAGRDGVARGVVIESLKTEHARRHVSRERRQRREQNRGKDRPAETSAT